MHWLELFFHLQEVCRMCSSPPPRLLKMMSMLLVYDSCDARLTTPMPDLLLIPIIVVNCMLVVIPIWDQKNAEGLI